MPYSAPIPWLLPWEPPSGMLKGSFSFLGRDDGTNRILSHDSNHIVNAAMWPKFGNASTFMREPIIASVLQVWPEKPLFWQDSLGSSSIKLGLSLGIALKFHTTVARGLKLKVRNCWGLIPTFVDALGEKWQGVFAPHPPSWLGLIIHDCCFFSNAFIHLTNFFLTPKVFSTIIQNWRSKESKLFLYLPLKAYLLSLKCLLYLKCQIKIDLPHL